MTHSNQNIELHVNNNMISDALTAVAHDTRTQTIAFAGLWGLFREGQFSTNWSIVAAAAQLECEVTTEFQEDCYQIFRELRSHQAAPGVPLCPPKKGNLSPELVPFIDVMRSLLLESIPAEARATAEPEMSLGKQYKSGMKLVKSPLNQQTYADMPRAMDSVDSLNSLGYRLNQDMTTLRNLPSELQIDYDQRFQARQMDILSTTWLHGDFYFKHTLDSRGRVYARSVLVTPQGDSFSKAFLDLAEAKPLGEFGLGALAVHFANCSGHDKLSFVDRIKWAKTEGFAKCSEFASLYGDWSQISKWIEDPKHAFEEYTAGMEFYRACHAEDAKLFESRLITHQDATTSGFQFGAALLGDRDTAALTNITGDCTKADKPADLYGEMAKHLTHLIGADAQTEARVYLPLVDRKFCKKPIMTTGYGASIKTIMKHIGEYCTDAKQPQLATTYNLAVLKPFIEQALELTASSMLQLSGTLRDAGKLLIEHGEEIISWTTPDGFTVYQQYRDSSERKIKLQRKSGIRARIQGEIDPIDESKMATALPPNFIHSIDAQLVRTAALNCHVRDIAIVPIHDSFGTHAGTFKALNKELRYAFAEVLEYDWFGEFRKANSVQLIIERGEYSADEALLGTYMFS